MKFKNQIKNKQEFTEQIKNSTNDKIELVQFFKYNHPKSNALLIFLKEALNGKHFEGLLDHSDKNLLLKDKFLQHDLIKINSINGLLAGKPRANSSSSTRNSNRISTRGDRDREPFTVTKLEQSTKSALRSTEAKMTKSLLKTDIRNYINYNSINIFPELKKERPAMDKLLTSLEVEASKSEGQENAQQKDFTNNFNRKNVPIVHFYKNGKLLREFHNIDLLNEISKENDKKLILDYIYELMVRKEKEIWEGATNDDVFGMITSCSGSFRMPVL